MIILFTIIPKVAGVGASEIENVATSTPEEITWLEEPRTVPEVKEMKVVKASGKTVVLKGVSVEGCENVRALASIYTDWDVEMVLQISKKESGCNSSNHNLKDKHLKCLGSYNVMQVGCPHYKSGEDINDASLNMKKAHDLWKKKNNFSDWTTCKKILGCR